MKTLLAKVRRDQVRTDTVSIICGDTVPGFYLAVAPTGEIIRVHRDQILSCLSEEESLGADKRAAGPSGENET